MFNSYLNQLNKFNPYAIENVKNKNFIHTLRKLEKLSMSKNSSNKEERTNIAIEQIYTQIKNNQSIHQIFEVYWNSSIRTMISFEQFSRILKEYHENINYQIVLEWIGHIIYNELDKNYYFIPILFKIDEPIIVHSDDVLESFKESPLDVKGRVLFKADDAISIKLQSVEEI